MRTFHIIFLISIGIFNVTQGQDLDSAHYGNNKYRAVMGGGQKVSRSAKVPLFQLIRRLEMPWKFAETGKAYWIGYTDDMYLIADHKDEAVPILVNFIDTSKNIKARKGGLYALHLIGIDEKVAGRFSENFVNAKARAALIRYLDDQSLNETVVYLLMRDPWLSDMPLLMAYLSKPGNDYSKVLSALVRYDFDNKPMGQKIDSDMVNSEIPVLHKDTNQYSAADPNYALFSYQKAFSKRFIVDTEITQSADGLKVKTKFTESKSYRTEYFGLGFSFLLNEVFNYCDFQSSYFYIFKDHILTLYGPVRTKAIWLDWWHKIPEKEKGLFYAYRHIPFSEKYKR